jgi:hypothetical protein
MADLSVGSTPLGLEPLCQEDDEEDDDPDQVENLSVHFRSFVVSTYAVNETSRPYS